MKVQVQTYQEKVTRKMPKGSEGKHDFDGFVSVDMLKSFALLG